MKREWIFRFLIIFFSITFLVSAFFLGRYYWNAYEQKRGSQALAAIVEQALKGEKPDKPQDPPDDESTDADAPAANFSAQEAEYVLVEDPKTGEELRLLKEYATIYTMNTDTVGWIKIEGTDINYPVMQSPDTPNFYLNHNFELEWDNHGCIYAQENCDIWEPSDNITIYGHRMHSGAMFYDLQNYKDKDYYKEHPVITFDTIREHWDYEILAVFLTNASVGGDGFPYHEFVNGDRDEFEDFVDTCKKLSLYDTGVKAQYGDKLITLSTCEYSQVNGRLVVVAKRVMPE